MYVGIFQIYIAAVLINKKSLKSLTDFIVAFCSGYFHSVLKELSQIPATYLDIKKAVHRNRTTEMEITWGFINRGVGGGGGKGTEIK